MKRLLLLLILSPVILLAQKQPQDVIDSNQDVAALNLQSMSSLMSNDQCAKVADIRITDNGEYNTTVVFRHRITKADSAGMVNTEYPSGEREPADRTPLMIGEITAIENIFLSAGPPRATDITAIENALLFPAPPEGVEIEPAENMLLSVGPPDITEIKAVEDIPLFPAFFEATEIVPSENMPLSASPPGIAETTHIENMPPFPDIFKSKEIRMPVENMHLSPDGYSLLQKMEGYSPALYNLNDGGYTIGFGFFVPFNEANKWGNGVTWPEAEHIMQQKMPAYEDQVKEYVNVPLTQNEFDALTMLAYNLGGFSKATSIINDVNNQEDFDKLQSDWKRFVHSKAPKVSKGLMNRRKDELEVRELSNYQPDRKIQILKSRK